jgi:hypothetical protein
VGQNGAIGLHASSDYGLALVVDGLNGSYGNTLITGLIENGNEVIGAPPDVPVTSSGYVQAPPYMGMMLRRFKSADSGLGAIVAYAMVDNTDPSNPAGVSLQRDGTAGGFQLVPDANLNSSLSISYSCEGHDVNDNAVNVHGSVNLQTNPTGVPVYSNSNMLLSFHCVFGRLQDAANMTEVTAARYGATYATWVGTIISDTNQ